MKKTSVDGSTLSWDEQGERTRGRFIIWLVAFIGLEVHHFYSPMISECNDSGLRRMKISWKTEFIPPPLRFAAWWILYLIPILSYPRSTYSIYHFSVGIPVLDREELDQDQPLVSRYHNNIHFMHVFTQLIRDLISRIPTSLHSQSTMAGAFTARSSQVDYGIQKKDRRILSSLSILAGIELLYRGYFFLSSDKSDSSSDAWG